MEADEKEILGLKGGERNGTSWVGPCSRKVKAREVVKPVYQPVGLQGD